MRWLLSLVLVGLATLVLSETPNARPVRRALIRPGPLIKLAVQPSIANEAVVLAETPEEVAPVAAAQPILPYVGAPQYWPGFGGPRNWYGWNRPAPAPFWGGYRQRNWRGLGGPYWRPRLVKPVVAPTDAADADGEPKADTDAAVDVAVVAEPVAEVDAGEDAGLDAGEDAGLDASGDAVDADIA